MRRTAFLTGRKKIPLNKFAIEVLEVGSQKLLTLALSDPKWFRRFPDSAKLFVHISENKNFEILDFGTLGKSKVSIELKSSEYSAPTCALRIISESENSGLVLASSSFTSVGKKDNGREGIIYFEPKDLGPRIWKLDIRDDDFPVVYVNKNIPEPQIWACQDPIFTSAVLPTVLEMVWPFILQNGDDAGTKWISSWIDWADQLMPGEKPPFDEEDESRVAWIEKLVDTFAQRHQLSDILLATFKTGS